MNPDPDLFLILASALLGVIGFPIARSISRRIEGRNAPAAPAALNAAIEDRLARIEQAVDSIAVEMERVSEGQRFTTRLLSERSGADAATSRDAGATTGR